MSLLKQLSDLDIKAINIGTDIFSKSMSDQDVESLNIQWTPPHVKDDEMLDALKKLYSEEVEEANQIAMNRFFEAEPVLIDVVKAIDIIPGMTSHTILHAGPPIEWENMSGPMKGAIIGLMLFENFAKTPDEAVKFVESGKIKFAPNHDYGVVGPMAGVTSASMYVHVVKNMKHGNLSFCPLTEGTGAKVLRFGAYDDHVIENFRWVHSELGETLHNMLMQSKGINLGGMISQALHMGDECHNRNKAGSSLFMRELFPLFEKANIHGDVFDRVMNNLNSNDHYFLSLAMPALKASLDAAHGVKNSTIVTALSRNGVEFGIRVSGCEGNTWFTGPSQLVEGLYLPGFSKEDANLDMGDSAITEAGGVGGFALAAAPAIVQFVGGTSEQGLETTKKMYEITFAENSNFSMPALDFRGGPSGIDVRKVLETGILPVITTGIAHKEAGVGFIGAGITNAPIDCFEKAVLELAKRV